MRGDQTLVFRRASCLAAGLLAVVVAAAGCGSRLASPAAGPSSPAAAKRLQPHMPVVNAAAFAGRGELAFVSRGRLWVLDGKTGTLRRVITPGVTPLDPAYSPDGRWLAFLGSSNNPPVQANTVWLARGDGSGAEPVAASGGLIGWSPVSDVLAVEAGTALRLIEPFRRAWTLTRAAGLSAAVWSPDGRYLAVATRVWPSATTLASYPVTGGRPLVWLRLNARSGVLNGMNQVIIDPAGWWPRWGIGFWVFGDGMVHNTDQAPLDVIPAPGKRPMLLGSTLPNGDAPEASAAGNGWLAVVDNSRSAFGRVIWQGKHVEACHSGLNSCAPVSSPPSTVTLDPAWSADGSLLAYVQAPYRASPGFPQKIVAAWYAAHQLWLYDPASGAGRELDAAGASVPVWSADGKSLLYVARDAIWLLPQLSGRPVPIAGPLFPPGRWPAYYGQVDWVGQFAWWPGTSPAAATCSPAKRRSDTVRYCSAP
jgi:dipeptidyl aminopeptidase/acylaminoacyl peptidase